MVVILSNIRSLHNVGSIFRTADAAGFKKVYLCGVTPAPVDCFGRPRPQLTKVSLGAERHMEWEKSQTTGRVINGLKDKGYKIIAIEQSPTSFLYTRFKPSRNEVEKFAVVMGSEIRGLSPAILKKSDKVLEIPMRGKKESLNVSVSFGVIAFYLMSLTSPQRKKRL